MCPTAMAWGVRPKENAYHLVYITIMSADLAQRQVGICTGAVDNQSVIKQITA